ncbi:hypothetical protein MA16_Dca011074 [Dendrobium catenatum]|uniref:Uncharacterized protein n=1 Tax=Dendrobium catenatum TaxID=906689 RepID=A0A2I0W3K7_9ASPA|nr:hypothetical protein MA16_Dca011074 [Dendrobium catenatum]
MELDVSKKHPSEVWIGYDLNGYFQKVEFENLPIFCSHCKMYGHGFNEYFRLHPHLHKDKAMSKQSQQRMDLLLRMIIFLLLRLKEIIPIWVMLLYLCILTLPPSILHPLIFIWIRPLWMLLLLCRLMLLVHWVVVLVIVTTRRTKG